MGERQNDCCCERSPLLPNRFLQQCVAMQFTYELTEQDFIEAYRAHRNRNAVSKWSVPVGFGFVALIGVLCVITATVPGNGEATKNLLPVFLLGFLWVILLSFLPRWNIKRQFRKQPGARGLKTVSFETDGLRWSGQNASGTASWENYIRWREGKNQVLLYNSPTTTSSSPLARLRQPNVSSCASC